MSNTAYTGTPVQPTATEDAHTIMVNSISWAAIFAGVVVGLVTQLLLTMLGAGIGLAALDVNSANNRRRAASRSSPASGSSSPA